MKVSVDKLEESSNPKGSTVSANVEFEGKAPVKVRHVYLNLETAVGCARVCRERRAWQGETKQRTLVRNEEQRSQDRRARCNRVHSAVT